MQKIRDKYFPWFENQGINIVGGTPKSPNAIKGLSIPSWLLIRLQHIFNFLLFHAILSFLDVLQSFYSNFVSFLGTNLLI